MIPVRLLTAALCAWAPLWAVTSPDFLPTLRSIESGMPKYQEVEATNIEIPSPAISLGISSKSYQCWKLQLTSERGKRLLELLQRLKSVRESLIALKASLAKDIAQFTVSPALDPALEQRIAAQSDSLSALFVIYQDLVEDGRKMGLVRKAPRGFLREHAAIVPIIQNNDYTMVFDDSPAECKTQGKRP